MLRSVFMSVGALLSVVLFCSDASACCKHRCGGCGSGCGYAESCGSGCGGGGYGYGGYANAGYGYGGYGYSAYVYGNSYGGYGNGYGYAGYAYPYGYNYVGNYGYNPPARPAVWYGYGAGR
jgi:hypothetical protein